MAEILPDGTMQGYYNTCDNCGKTIEVNMQGTPINHKCEVKNLDIPHVSLSVCKECEKNLPMEGTEICQWCALSDM